MISFCGKNDFVDVKIQKKMFYSPGCIAPTSAAISPSPTLRPVRPAGSVVNSRLRTLKPILVLFCFLNFHNMKSVNDSAILVESNKFSGFGHSNNVYQEPVSVTILGVNILTPVTSHSNYPVCYGLIRGVYFLRSIWILFGK